MNKYLCLFLLSLQIWCQEVKDNFCETNYTEELAPGADYADFSLSAASTEEGITISWEGNALSAIRILGSGGNVTIDCPFVEDAYLEGLHSPREACLVSPIVYGTFPEESEVSNVRDLNSGDELYGWYDENSGDCYNSYITQSTIIELE